ncbi:CotH kinase family protein [Aquimarina gracilis]|uniref:CotH kinase family protein n=1 Tax=Aquimarina gracilis TaxID=874422 RepID=A0ABU5ZVM9_9FLAO|nr:CotH kinase family protein [Aquimarina gracilis]MEB3345916.1 CotH kinase family protein [Aquimarina gracilis]
MDNSKNGIKHFILSGICFILLTILPVTAQKNQLILPAKESYGVDYKNKIIVWNLDIKKTSNQPSALAYKVSFENKLSLSIPIDSLSYSKKYQIQNRDTIFLLYLTELPLIKIAADTILDDPKKVSNFSYFHKDTIRKANAGIEFRGNISLKFPKKSFDLEFWEDIKEKTSIDMQFADLRDDDDWILDGLYNEPLRLRSYIANKLWLSIHQPYYQDQEKDAKSGINLLFAEVFLNDQYVGIHALMEQVDRKLLQLKKYKKLNVRGELFKASSYDGAPSFKNAPKYKNIFPHWAGYEVEYPYENYKAQWKNIYKFTKFVIKAKDSVFKKKISKKFYLDNAIDYFLFVNLLRATDNLGKNFYISRYTKKTPYFKIPWDLDGTLGTIQDGKRIPTTDDILSNGLFDRLLKVNPNNYRKRLKERWTILRKRQLSNDALFKNIQDQYNYFLDHKIYEREQLIWSTDISLLDHLNYMKDWLSDRLQYLDTYFNDL